MRSVECVSDRSCGPWAPLAPGCFNFPGFLGIWNPGLWDFQVPAVGRGNSETRRLALKQRLRDKPCFLGNQNPRFLGFRVSSSAGFPPRQGFLDEDCLALMGDRRVRRVDPGRVSFSGIQLPGFWFLGFPGSKIPGFQGPRRAATACTGNCRRGNGPCRAWTPSNDVCLLSRRKAGFLGSWRP